MSDYSIHIVIAVVLFAGIVGLMLAIDKFKSMEDECTSETVSSPPIYETVSSPPIYETVSSPRIYEIVSSPRIYEIVSSPRIYEIVSSPRIYETFTGNIKLEDKE